jgi:hypothetical protein
MGQKIILALSVLIAGFILFMGVVLLATSLFMDRIQQPNRTYIGILFILYACYRGYRAKLQYDKMKLEER